MTPPPTFKPIGDIARKILEQAERKALAKPYRRTKSVIAPETGLKPGGFDG